MRPYGARRRGREGGEGLGRKERLGVWGIGRGVFAVQGFLFCGSRRNTKASVPASQREGIPPTPGDFERAREHSTRVIMPPKFKAPRGTQDILPQDSWRWQRLEAAFREVCRRYGYREIRTPLFEETELFAAAWVRARSSSTSRCTPSRTGAGAA